VRSQVQELFRTGKKPYLLPSLANRKTEMQIENLERMAVASNLLDSKRRVLAAPAFAAADRQVDVSFSLDRIAAQCCIAVAPLAQADIVAYGEVRVAQRFGKLPCQVHLARTGNSLVDLLQQYEIAIVMGKDLDDPIGTERPVDADGAMDVVRDDPKPHASDTLRSHPA